MARLTTIRESKRTAKLAQSVKPAPAVPTNEDEDVDKTDEEEDSGIDEEGLEKLMKALGEDGLDEFDLAQLRMLSGTAAPDEEGSSEDEERSEEDDADEKILSEDAEPMEGDEMSEADEEIALDDEDVESVDQDAIPRRKVQVDNKVRPSMAPSLCELPLFNS